MLEAQAIIEKPIDKDDKDFDYDQYLKLLLKNSMKDIKWVAYFTRQLHFDDMPMSKIEPIADALQGYAEYAFRYRGSDYRMEDLQLLDTLYGVYYDLVRYGMEAGILDYKVA